MALTEIAIKALKPKNKIYRIAAEGGLYLEVNPNGSKYWRLKYRYAGKEKRLAIGVYPAISLKIAREKRDEAKKLIGDGIDPVAKRQEVKRLVAFNADNTFGAVAKEWFDTNMPKWTSDHAARLWRRIEANILPEIGHRPISEVKSLELLNAIRKIEKRGATELSHRILNSCGAIFRYAIVTGRIEYNHAQDLRGALIPHKAENYPTIQVKELPNFFKKLEKVETSLQNKLAIRLLMLTFIRQGELRQAKWVDIDFKTNEWRLPAPTTKMKALHIVPLVNHSIEVLKELNQLTGGSELLFPSQQRRRHAIMSENTINQVLKKMGYKDKLVGHGFRALASTTLNEHGFRPDVIERQLAHTERNKVRAAYNRAQYLDERRNMMQWWGDYLDNVASDSGSNIIQLKQSK